MKYYNMKEGRFLDRPNRFIAHVEIDGQLETVHVKNTGRCRELLLPGARVMLEHSDNPNRKTAYDLISVWKPSLGWVNMDSQVTNKVMGEWLGKQDWDLIRPEYKFGDSRLDFYLERGEEKVLLEVKGCTLEVDGLGYFPDAPSQRASKHCRELTHAVEAGYRCVIAYVIAMEGVPKVLPNEAKDPAYAKALGEAKAAGVEIWNMRCKVGPDTIEIVDCLIEVKAHPDEL